VTLARTSNGMLRPAVSVPSSSWQPGDAVQRPDGDEMLDVDVPYVGHRLLGAAQMAGPAGVKQRRCLSEVGNRPQPQPRKRSPYG
jgi:hypothetical protein